MKAIEKDFIDLTKEAVMQNYSDDGFFEYTNWEEVFKLAVENGLPAVIYDVVSKQKSLPEDLRQQWDRFKFSVFVRQKGHFRLLCKLLDQFEAEGLHYAIFKGPVVAACYPNSAYRPSSDTDILVKEEDRAKAGEIILSVGYKRVEEKGNQHVDVFYYPQNGHMIELHTSVFEDYEGEKINVLAQAGIMNFDSHIRVDVDGYEMWTLNYDEHLLYLFFHLIKHFILEGGNVKFFTDITCFINKYEDKLNPDYFWNWVEKLHYSDFCVNFLNICVDYFGMKPGFLNGKKPVASKAALETLIVDFIYNGDEEKLRASSWQMTATFTPYLVGERTSVKKSKFGRTMKYLFPKPSELNENYEYAKKCPLLLPIAWVHRVIHKIQWQANDREDEYTAVQKVELVESRLGLMASVGLLEEE